MVSRRDDSGDGFGSGGIRRTGEEPRVRVGLGGQASEEQALADMRREVRDAVHKVESRAARRRAGIGVSASRDEPTGETRRGEETPMHDLSPVDAGTTTANSWHDRHPENADTLDNALPAFAGSPADASPETPGGAPEPAAQRPTRRRWPLRILSFVLLLGLGAGVAFLLGRNQSDERIALQPAPTAQVGGGSDTHGEMAVGNAEAGDSAALDAEQREEIERLLSSLGFRTGPVDGEIDAKTSQAIQAFQRISGNDKPDGKASPALLERLRTMIATAGN